MGIALKRRDNAPIVKYIFGGAIDIIMNEHNVEKSLEFVKTACHKLLKGEFPLSEFIISKTLKSFYKKPQQIAHNVLACRQAQRDPGNRFEPNDRVPYAFIATNVKNQLQGNRIETPEFIRQNKLTLDYRMYLTNQIMKPVSQIFELVPGYENIEDIFNQMMDCYENERTGTLSMDQFVKKRDNTFAKLSDLIKQSRADKIAAGNIVEVDVDEDDDHCQEIIDDDEVDDDTEDGVEGTSNYDDPNF
jgi:DNA polymerase elongation subunit (family B)